MPRPRLLPWQACHANRFLLPSTRSPRDAPTHGRPGAGGGSGGRACTWEPHMPWRRIVASSREGGVPSLPARPPTRPARSYTGCRYGTSAADSAASGQSRLHNGDMQPGPVLPGAVEAALARILASQTFRGGERVRISSGGGVQARFRADGRELFYLTLDGQFAAVPLTLPADGRTVRPGTPVPLFHARVGGLQGARCITTLPSRTGSASWWTRSSRNRQRPSPSSCTGTPIGARRGHRSGDREAQLRLVRFVSGAQLIVREEHAAPRR